jgi:alpha-amylase/alpha-mannosidase (GH57 family)
MTFSRHDSRSELVAQSAFQTDFSLLDDSDYPALGGQRHTDAPACDTQGPISETGIYVTVHGHFYQPPRENPYLNAIERQPSASPYHDWNERIHHECYRPNAFARILSDQGNLLGIVNNYEYLSFNIGPTLMSWLEQADPEVYQRILEADRKSCDRLGGHGNAIAQVYNHIILPLASDRDKRTQIRWGKADFKARFGRDPEGMWLSETAVDYPTLKILVEEGIRFIILAPSQAQRCRPLPTPDERDPHWIEVGGGQIDPVRPYRCFLNQPTLRRDGVLGQDSLSEFGTESGNGASHANAPYIDIFFYDGPISRDMGFNDVLSSSQHFVGRVGQAVRGDHRTSQLISVATDGETFGHHKGGTEKALAYAFIQEFPQRGWLVTNFAHYLSLHPPTWEVELKPVTAWSCAHGVDRWQDDCGCGGGGAWHQKWRRPLRDTLDWLRDQLVEIYEQHGSHFFGDVWAARDGYVAVVGDRSDAALDAFFANYQSHDLTPAERVEALKLLEMQRHALLMYTSCGWFFEEVSRPEGTQVLRYAARALELAEEIAAVRLEPDFLRRLATIPSNVEIFENGAELYRQLVAPARITLEQVAAHYAISSLFHSYPQEQRLYCYAAQRLDYQLRRMGSLTLAVGQVQLTSEITREVMNLEFAVLHLGGWDFHCCIQPASSRHAYLQLRDELLDALSAASAAQVILAMTRIFGDSQSVRASGAAHFPYENRPFSLQDLFAEERHRLMHLLSQETLTRLDQLYTQVYRDNYGVLRAFHRDALEPPRELQVAAEIAIAHRLIHSLQALERETSDLPPTNPELCDSYLSELEAIATEVHQLRCQLTVPQAKQILERLILRLLWQVLNESKLDSLAQTQTLDWISKLLVISEQLHLGLALDRAQELYWRSLHRRLLPHWSAAQHSADPTDKAEEIARLQPLLSLGKLLSIEVPSTVLA